MKLQINPADNVAVDLSTGHKAALRDIREGENVIKYGYPIGHATRDIREGERVHTDNVRTNLGGTLTYEYQPQLHAPAAAPANRTFMGYLRSDGQAGIRNDVWIVNTVGCINRVADTIAARTGALSFPHPFGCSQLGDDHAVTQHILRGMVRHPNAGGVLVLGLGCENNQIAAFRESLGDMNFDRVRFLNAQDVEDEVEEGVRLVRELQALCEKDVRQPLDASLLRVGLKCGGSDGLSGITANPLVGRFSDLLTACGGTTVLTEVPEMFGAETLLMQRCESREVFDKTVAMVNQFKEYFIRHGQVVYENPSPGNKAGGITTLEEKSLGCVQKGGMSTVVDVLDYGDTLKKSGLNLLNGPGNDIVAITNLMACGAHLILFTTGRGTPVGGAVPTVKISTNTPLYEKKPHWMDFDAGPIAQGADMDALAAQLFDYVLDVAGGRETNNEKHGYREISIFKDGVTL